MIVALTELNNSNNNFVIIFYKLNNQSVNISMKVYIAKKPSRGAAGKYPEVDGVVRIDVSSGSKKKLNGINMSDLSPMKLKINGVIFENYWQYGKVYDCHVDEYGNIKDTYWTWRENGRNSNKGKRRPLPKNKPLYF